MKHLVALAILSSLGLSSCDKTKQLGFSAESSKAGAVALNGLTSLSITAGGKYVLLWDLASGSTDVTAVSYEVYLDRWSEIPENVKPKVATGSEKTSSTTLLQGAFIAELDESKTPSSKGLLVSSVKGGRSYSIEDTLSTGTIYVFQVKSVATNGSKDNNNRVIIYNPDNSFLFKGLQTSGVVLSQDLSKISLSWAAATGAKSTPTYLVYSDSSFTSVIFTTTATTYDFPNPEKGKTYTFAVRAKDGGTLDGNSEFVVISVPDPSDKTPPTFAGLKSAEATSDKKVLLKWDASPSSDLSVYKIYNRSNLTTSIASTTLTTYSVTGLTSATSYTFVVRAEACLAAWSLRL